ncbi:MAG: peroxidase family protein, partial [Terricaulis sp.]
VVGADGTPVMDTSRWLDASGHPTSVDTGLLNPNFGRPLLNDIGLIDAFLNPLEYAAAGADAAGEIVLGTVNQIGNEIDEFVTGALRNNLLGLPLDLAALNIARGRDTGVPPLNLLRAQIYAATQDTSLKPYSSWAEFGAFLKHAASLINFVAAYGTHASVLAAGSMEAKRAAALDLVMSGLDEANKNSADLALKDAYDFMHSTGVYANDLANPLSVHATWSTGSITGVDSIDLWIGGLAEKQNLFGGLLGSTFNFIFETQLENLQDGDRLYYLPRIEGMHWGSEIEGNTFASMIMANTGIKHLPASIFLTPEYVIEASTYFQHDATGAFVLDAAGNRIATDSSTWLRNPVTGALLVEVLPDGTVHFIGDDNFFGNTIVLGGTEGNDRLMAGNADDDTVWGDGGDDVIDGGNGNDQLFGGDGNDVITDTAGNDIIHGEAGNDRIFAGIGDDVVFGGDGNDVIDGGQGLDAISGGVGNDIIRGGEDDDELVGNEGDDWIEGGIGGDLLNGDQGAPTGQVPLFAAN